MHVEVGCKTHRATDAKTLNHRDGWFTQPIHGFKRLSNRRVVIVCCGFI